MTHTPDKLRAIAQADLIERAPVMVWLRFWKSHLPAKAVRQLQELAPVASLDRLAALEAERDAGEARVVFQLGDRVRVLVTNDKPWSLDWQHDNEHFVSALRWINNALDIEISEEWPPVYRTDGFAADDLAALAKQEPGS